jgi:hypothetical protein
MVQDIGRLDSDSKYPKYARVLVKTFQVYDSGKIDARIGML